MEIYHQLKLLNFGNTINTNPINSFIEKKSSPILTFETQVPVQRMNEWINDATRIVQLVRKLFPLIFLIINKYFRSGGSHLCNKTVYTLEFNTFLFPSSLSHVLENKAQFIKPCTYRSSTFSADVFLRQLCESI